MHARVHLPGSSSCSSVQTRTVPPESVAYWVERIAEMEGEIGALLSEEAEDKALRVAEMEANKASNVLEHHDEIMSRPARSWFQSEKERKAAVENSKREAPTAQASEPKEVKEAKPKIKRDKYAGLTRKQRRARQRAEMFAADAEAEEEGGGQRRLDALDMGQKSAKRAARKEERGFDVVGVAAKRRLSETAPGKEGGAKKAKAAPREKAEQGAPRKNPLSKKARSHSKPKFSKARKKR